MNRDIEHNIGRAQSREIPEHLSVQYKRAIKLEWLTVVYLATVVVVMYLAMGSSAAMKAAWVEDAVSLFPSIAFLCASAVAGKAATARKPYGYHKAFTVAFVVGSVALLVLGLYILIDSSLSLIKKEHPTIGSASLFGQEIWMGWLMILALLYSFIPAVILGQVKLPLASELHEKVLYVDSEAQKADWMTAGAGILGIVGVGFGLWWADSVAAVIISLSIVKDGVFRTRDCVQDLMEELPMTFDNKEFHPLVDEVVRSSLAEYWVKDVRVRMREHGMVFFGEVAVIPESEENLVQNIKSLFEKIQALDWKVYDIVVHPVEEFAEERMD